MKSAADLDSPERETEIRARIREKPALRRLYEETYARYRDVISRSPGDGVILELGSGGGFTAEAVPGVVTSDVIPYAGVERVVDATRLPFENGTIRALLLYNVLHHISNAPAFFREASRCLKPGGRMLIVDQYPGWPARWIYRYAHHEGYDAESRKWEFPAAGPLSGANGALAWMIFVRDRVRFASEFPALEIVRLRPHTPLRYWLCGGLKRWSLLPEFAFGAATALDRLLGAIWPGFASFVDIELVRKDNHPDDAPRIPPQPAP